MLVERTWKRKEKKKKTLNIIEHNAFRGGREAGIIIENELKLADKRSAEVIIFYSLEFQSSEAPPPGKLEFTVTTAHIAIVIQRMCGSECALFNLHTIHRA